MVRPYVLYILASTICLIDLQSLLTNSRSYRNQIVSIVKVDVQQIKKQFQLIAQAAVKRFRKNNCSFE